MRQWLWAPLVGALILGMGAAVATAGTNPGAVIGLHIQANSGTAGTCQTYIGYSCELFTTNVNTPGDYDIYVTVSQYDTVGIAGLQFGVAYDSTPGQGFDITNWYSCGDLNFPGVGWPGSNTGTLLTWEPTFNCQGEDRVRMIPICAGVFQVYANGPDAFSVIPRPVDGRAKVADCQSAEDDITDATPSRLGMVTFGSQSGYNPCAPLVPVESTTWGAIKTLYEQ